MLVEDTALCLLKTEAGSWCQHQARVCLSLFSPGGSCLRKDGAVGHAGVGLCRREDEALRAFAHALYKEAAFSCAAV